MLCRSYCSSGGLSSIKAFWWEGFHLVPCQLSIYIAFEPFMNPSGAVWEPSLLHVPLLGHSPLLSHSLSLRSLRSPGLKTGRLLSPCPALGGLPGIPFHAPVDPDLGFWFKLREQLLSGVWLWLDFEMTRHPSFIFFGYPDLGFLTLPTHPGCWRLVPNSKTFLVVFIYLFRCYTSAFMPKKRNLWFVTIHSLDKHACYASVSHETLLYLLDWMEINRFISWGWPYLWWTSKSSSTSKRSLILAFKIESILHQSECA